MFPVSKSVHELGELHGRLGHGRNKVGDYLVIKLSLVIILELVVFGEEYGEVSVAEVFLEILEVPSQGGLDQVGVCENHWHLNTLDRTILNTNSMEKSSKRQSNRISEVI